MPCDRFPKKNTPLEVDLVVEFVPDVDARPLDSLAEFLVELYFTRRSLRAQAQPHPPQDEEEALHD